MKKIFFYLIISTACAFSFGNVSKKIEEEPAKKAVFNNIMVSLSPYESAMKALKDEREINWEEDLKKANSTTIAFAASELKTHFKLLGQNLKVINYNPKTISKTIVLTTKEVLTANHPLIAEKVVFDSLGSQGFAIIAEKRAVFIVANSRIGILYGAYDLLKTIGFAWYNPQETLVPKRINPNIKSYQMVKTPLIELRGFWTFSKKNLPIAYVTWLARNQFNICGSIEPYLAKKLGFKIWGGGHNLIQEEFSKPGLFEKHPEWYTLYKDKRFPVSAKGNYVNPSYANEDAAKYFSEQLIERLESGDLKEVDILNIWPSDKRNIRMDESKNAKSIGNFSDALLHFYAEIAQKLYEAYNDNRLNRKVLLAGISYHTTMKAPTNNSIIKKLEARDYLHVFYPSNRDWSSSISSDLDHGDVNIELVKAIDSWKKSTKFNYGFVDYNLKSNYSGLSITNHKNFAKDFDYYFKEKGGLYAYMHPVKNNPGPLELTNALIATMCWKSTNESSLELQEKVTEQYFNKKYGRWSIEWHEIYDHLMSSVSNSKHIFESGSLSSILFQNIYWAKPPFTKKEAIELLPKYLEGGNQSIPNGYNYSSDKLEKVNFVGLLESIEIQSEMKLKWDFIIKNVKDAKIASRMKNDIVWFESTISRYRLMSLCSSYLKAQYHNQNTEELKESISVEIAFLESTNTTEDFISPVGARNFISVVKKFISEN